MIRTNDNTKGTKTILVVDDPEDMRQAAVAMLSLLGYNVLEAKDGPSALEVLGQDGKGIDLVFSDVFMPPGVNGLELARELHRRYPHIKILLTSGLPGMILNKDGIDGTGFTVLRKPYKMADLAEAVRTAFSVPDLTVTRRVCAMMDEYVYRDSTVTGRRVVAVWIVAALILLVVVLTTGI